MFYYFFTFIWSSEKEEKFSKMLYTVVWVRFRTLILKFNRLLKAVIDFLSRRWCCKLFFILEQNILKFTPQEILFAFHSWWLYYISGRQQIFRFRCGGVVSKMKMISKGKSKVEFFKTGFSRLQNWRDVRIAFGSSGIRIIFRFCKRVWNSERIVSKCSEQ